ncbi:EcoEI R domain protein [Rippkaea orientalis PCC 8801]|uniref:EcoEI R domain protein n=1 Tax=Rippkaea orientalis (strain PCC 8801 / RF-1) TaxID=41431 RepID=B7JWD2_RIPO1|nr:DEAD/DEAH box helicase family protein [Rippkaea orientalis]ACK66977.1 EcoEI R domain protein [Rippkaea orientalis PCC 8801]
MTSYNEADTRAKLIDPQLKLSGWGENQIEREHYFAKRQQITAGRIYLVGDQSRRRQPCRVDYLLRYQGQAIAVLEAKDESHSVDAGLEQAKAYARKLDLPFAFASNGHSFIEFDFFSSCSQELSTFPTPQQLWQRWETYRQGKVKSGRVAENGGNYGVLSVNPLLYPVCPESQCGKVPRYFQEVAIRRVIERILKQQRRILLTMATGTGKTFTAFQIVWKLKQSGWLRKPILFLSDRLILRDQSYNTFAPFVAPSADPRGVIEKGKFNSNRELYFALYQALDALKEGESLFSQIPADFFGLIIIDECHRSGFGKWNGILQHFTGAIQLGMTATPKQDESIDTYAYFCAEESEIPLDPDDNSKGTWKPPAYQYSLGQGIDDGFLATYKVHKVRTTVDKNGLHLQEARIQGAEIYIPEDVEPRQQYLTGQFEREITLPDRTKTMVSHLAGLLRQFGEREKTMVFCVDMTHARLVARLLQNEFAELGYSNYAVPIVSEEGEAQAWLEQFQDSDRLTPIVATTAELLSTGVNVPSCRNIVFMKPISSPILFKQIIGRGSRIDPATGKEWFRIIDYVGASRLFDQWDRPIGELPQAITGARTSIIEGRVIHGDTEEFLVGASVSALIGVNQQLSPILTDDNGYFRLEALPAGKIRLFLRGNGFRSREITLETAENETLTVVLALNSVKPPVGKIRVEGLEVTIADEVTFIVDATGEQLTLAQYLDYTKAKIRGYVPNWSQLHQIWIDSEQRKLLLRELTTASVYIEVLGEVLAQPKADQFDLLAHIAFNKPIHTRDERVEAFLNYEQWYLEAQTEEAREVILGLLDKYRLAGIEEIVNPEVFRLSPFQEMGQIKGVILRLGTMENLRQIFREIQQKLYRQ